jgi:hypothetical protein
MYIIIPVVLFVCLHIYINSWKVLKCGAGGGWKRSVGLIMREMKKYCLKSRSRGISYMKYVNRRRTGLVTFCLETAFHDGLLEERYKGRGIEVTRRQGRICRKLVDDLKERRGYSHLKEEALDRTMWRARFG